MDPSALVAAAPDLRLESERLVLRRFGVHDVPAAVAQEQDRDVMRWIRDPEPVEAAEARALQMASPWRGNEGEWLALALTHRGDARMIGLVVGRVTVAAHATMEIGYRLSREAHGRGYGTEACARWCDHLFGTVGARKLVAFCASANEASWRLMQKLGMQREATLREHSWLDGAWRDELVYGLLAREWRNAR